MRTVSAILANTAREILRDKILYGLIFFAAVLILTSVLLGGLSFAEQTRIITNLGLVAGQVGCVLIAIFIGSSLVWKEIEKQTILTLLSKPVSRTQFLIGKFLGLAWVILIVNILVALMVALVCGLFGKVFWTPFLISQIGILFESWLLLSLALFFGTFSRPLMTTFFTLSLWVIGHSLGDLAYFSSKSQSPLTQSLGTFLSKALPNFETFNFKEAAVYGDIISNHDILQALIVFGLWFGVLWISSTWIFEKRDFT